MRRLIERYGFVLGYLALSALLAAAVRYLVWRQVDAWAEGLLIGGAVLGALFVLAHPAQVRAIFTRRGARYGSNAALMSVAFVSILIGLNYVAQRGLDVPSGFSLVKTRFWTLRESSSCD